MDNNWLSEDAVTFLVQLKENNSKQWFQDHKGDYEEFILEPLREFVCELSSTMLDIDEDFEVRPSVDKTISRLYRDTRFSKDKSLYKDRVWVTFKRRGASKMDYPSFFFEFTPDSYRYGMGFFLASPSSMNAFRNQIDEKEAEFERIVKKICKENRFVPEGDMYKKNRYQGKREELASWYNRKNIYLVHNGETNAECFDRQIIDEIKKGFVTLKDFYLFLVRALDN